MSRSVAGTTLNVVEETNTGLILHATIDNGLPPATAGIYAAGATVTDLSTGYSYKNQGSSAAPSFAGSPVTSGLVAQVSLTAANLIAMFTTPVLVVAGVPNMSIVVDSVDFDITRTSTAFTGGGVVAVQYNNTANGAGTLTHATIAATVVTGSAGRTISTRVPAVAGQSDVASASIVGIGLYISNATAAFAAGTGTAVCTVRYHLV